MREIPQVRLSEDFAEALLPYAKMTNADMIWMNATATVHESTLAHSMNLLGVPTLVLEMGQGHDIHRSFGNQIVDGIFHIMSEMGIWTGPEPKVQEPAISSDGEVEFIRSKSDGVFLPLIEHNHYVKKGDLIVANNLRDEGAGFGTDTNVVTLVMEEGIVELPCMSKEQVAEAVLDAIQNA